jgi:Icc-related predicted phosphoesterase
MKIVFISDTHGLHDNIMQPIPDGDILVHCGDVSNYGSISQLTEFISWFIGLPHKHKVFIGGNHDFGLEKKQPWIEDGLQSLPENVHYLEDSGVEIEGIKFWGMPWTPRFYNWAFMTYTPEEAQEKAALIPEDTEILVTHGPPRGVLDLTTYGAERVGCIELAARLYELPNVKVHSFGHIHEEYGVEELNDRTYINASICTLRYSPSNAPIVLERYFDSMNNIQYKRI